MVAVAQVATRPSVLDCTHLTSEALRQLHTGATDGLQMEGEVKLRDPDGIKKPVWRARWAQLSGDCLLVYGSRDDRFQGHLPLYIARLAAETSVVLAGDATVKLMAGDSDGELQLTTSSDAEADRWCSVLQGARQLSLLPRPRPVAAVSEGAQVAENRLMCFYDGRTEWQRRDAVRDAFDRAFADLRPRQVIPVCDTCACRPVDLGRVIRWNSNNTNGSWVRNRLRGPWRRRHGC
jgi:hypothetical protein